MERPEVIKMLNTIIEDNDIKAHELNLGKADWDTLKGICKSMYEKIESDAGSKSEAYEWACEEIDSYWRDILDIQPVKMFKHATATLELDVMVPQNFDREDIAVLIRDLCQCIDVESFVEIDDENIEECDIDHYDYTNSPYDYTDGDFN